MDMENAFHWANKNSVSTLTLSYVKMETLLKILSFATNHYATSMQLVVVCNYLGHVYNYKFGVV